MKELLVKAADEWKAKYGDRESSGSDGTRSPINRQNSTSVTFQRQTSTKSNSGESINKKDTCVSNAHLGTHVCRFSMYTRTSNAQSSKPMEYHACHVQGTNLYKDKIAIHINLVHN